MKRLFFLFFLNRITPAPSLIKIMQPLQRALKSKCATHNQPEFHLFSYSIIDASEWELRIKFLEISSTDASLNEKNDFSEDRSVFKTNTGNREYAQASASGQYLFVSLLNI